eukprot:6489394-Amphidinium_carterae.1
MECDRKAIVQQSRAEALARRERLRRPSYNVIGASYVHDLTGVLYHITQTHRGISARQLRTCTLYEAGRKPIPSPLRDCIDP